MEIFAVVWIFVVSSHKDFAPLARRAGATPPCCSVTNMAAPHPIELSWVMRSAPQEHGITPVLRAAVECKWQETRQLAAALLGDDSQAPEMTEIAIERTVTYLAERPPLGIHETGVVFLRFYRQEIRRRRAKRARLSLRGTATDLPDKISGAPLADVDNRLDLEAMLRATKPEVRTALLLRYGRNERWSDVAASTGTTKEGIRKSCKRELERIRKRLQKLGLSVPKLSQSPDGPERNS